jgi:hypothetical protein
MDLLFRGFPAASEQLLWRQPLPLGGYCDFKPFSFFLRNDTKPSFSQYFPIIVSRSFTYKSYMKKVSMQWMPAGDLVPLHSASFLYNE